MRLKCILSSPDEIAETGADITDKKLLTKGEEIPAELYKAVAEVLIFVLRLSGRVR